MEYKEYRLEEVYEIKELWQQLISHLEKNSTYYKSFFQTRVFDERIQPYIDKVRHGKYQIIIVHDNNEKIGYIISSITKENLGEIDSIFVNPKYRSKKLGDTLMKKALNFFENNDCESIVLGVSEGNEEVIKFYQKYGFKMKRYIMSKEV